MEPAGPLVRRLNPDGPDIGLCSTTYTRLLSLLGDHSSHMTPDDSVHRYLAALSYTGHRPTGFASIACDKLELVWVNAHFCRWLSAITVCVFTVTLICVGRSGYRHRIKQSD